MTAEGPARRVASLLRYASASDRPDWSRDHVSFGRTPYCCRLAEIHLPDSAI